MDASQPTVEECAVRDGRFVAVGSLDEVLDSVGTDQRIGCHDALRAVTIDAPDSHRIARIPTNTTRDEGRIVEFSETLVAQRFSAYIAERMTSGSWAA